jgi:ABC-2 type transport system permease protein
MAVYEHNYKPYTGTLTPHWARFLVLPRYAYESVFKSKFAVGFFALSYVCPLIYTILIYLHHNVTALAALGVDSADLVKINGEFFGILIGIQVSLAFILTVVIGPVLISRDLANNALPLYLCRPFSRWEYLLGKASVLLLLQSAITWIPGLLLFIFQAYLEGGGWLADNLWIARAIIVSSWAWIVTLTLLVLALSAWIKWRVAASAALFAVFIIPLPLGGAIIEAFKTWRGFLFSVAAALDVVVKTLFRVESEFKLSPAECWGTLIVTALICLWMLSRKLRAYEVVT